MNKLYLFDVSSLFFRAYYAIQPLSSPSGHPTNAIYGFLFMMMKIKEKLNPEYAVFCYDHKKPSFRKKIDPSYKANRAEMPENLAQQIPFIKKINRFLGGYLVEQEGFEADDLIGTLSAWGEKEKMKVIIVSNDKDFSQLVNENISLYDPAREIYYDPPKIKEKWGVNPHQFRDYLSIVGDSSDNIRGIKGIGHKGAIKLLEKFQTLDGIYKHLHTMQPSSTLNKLKEGKESAYKAQKLVSLVKDVSLDFSKKDFKFCPPDQENLYPLLNELGFKNLTRKFFPGVGSDLASNSTSDATSNATDVFSNKENKNLKEISFGSLNFCIKSWLEKASSVFVFPFQKNHYLSNGQELVCCSPEHLEDLGRPIQALELTSEQEIGSKSEFKSKPLWTGFGLKSFFRKCKVSKVKNLAWDNQIAYYIIKGQNIKDDRDFLFAFHGFSYNFSDSPDCPDSPNESKEDISPSDSKEKTNPTANIQEIYRLHKEAEKDLKELIEYNTNYSVLFKDIELPLSSVLMEMESRGILIDPQILKRQGDIMDEELSSLKEKIHEMAGGTDFNISSPKQLAFILFEKLQLPKGKKLKTGYSTSSSVLIKLKNLHPVIDEILKYRELTKLKTTYLDGLLVSINETTHRIHTHFQQTLTSTGRLSSIKPNLQNIPIRTERGKAIRRAFIAPPGQQLLSCDYNQIELRILAHISKDQHLCQAFLSDKDVHLTTASELFSVPPDKVTPEMRRKAKGVNFGIIYGQGAFGLSESLNISLGEAKKIIGDYFIKFPGVAEYIERQITQARKQGYVETLWGRRRYIPELGSKNIPLKKFGERVSINAPIQGTASDLVKKVMVTLGRQPHLPILLQVHDELLFEVPEEKAESYKEEVVSLMEQVCSLTVPLKVSASLGSSWYDISK